MKELIEYNIEDKVKWFNKMYKDAREQLKYLRENGCEMKDASNYTWEKVMELLGKDIWKEYNSLNS